MTTGSSDLTERKTKHLEICTDVATYQPESGHAGFDQVRFQHRAMPELHWDEIKTETEFLGRPIRLPLFISSMTGGSEASYAVNKALARAAQAAGVPVGMGSIRILYRKPEAFADFHLRPLAPDVPIFSNLGAQQLVEERLRDQFASLNHWNARLEVDAVAIHLNPGQELFQSAGDRDFRGIRDILEEFIAQSPLPVIVKETGFGIAPDEVDFLLKIGAAAVDVAGSGGTNWLKVEAYRGTEAEQASATDFADWGWSTAPLLAAIGHRKGRILASGGLRSGLDLAKALALGAQAGGFALPLIRAVQSGGADAVGQQIQVYEKSLRTAMLLTTSRTVADLRKAPLDLTKAFAGQVKQWKKG